MTEYQLTSLVGKKVQLDRGGPESKIGTILAVGDDYLTLSTTDEGIIYYYVDHIKSITIVKSESSETALNVDNASGLQANYETPASMKEIYHSKKYSMIQINRGGPQTVTGVLTEIFDNYIAVALKEEVLLIVHSHIKSCSFPVLTNKEEKDKDGSKDSNKNDNKNGNKDGSKDKNQDKQDQKQNNKNENKDSKNKSKSSKK